MKNKFKRDLTFVKGWKTRTVISIILAFVIHLLLDLGGIVDSPSRYNWTFNHIGNEGGYATLVCLVISLWIALYLMEAWLYGNDEIDVNHQNQD